MTTRRALQILVPGKLKRANPLAPLQSRQSELKQDIDSLVIEIQIIKLKAQIKAKKEALEKRALKPAIDPVDLKTSASLVWLSSFSNAHFSQLLANFLVEGLLYHEENEIKANLKKKHRPIYL